MARHTPHQDTQDTAQDVESTAAEAAPRADAADVASAAAGHAHAEANYASAPSTTLKIADIDVIVPLKFTPGHVLTDTQARILDAAYQRQFINNQTALAKARTERLAKATTEADRIAHAPLTAEQIAALYMDYEPNVGREARGSTLDRLRATAAWQVWAETIDAHNKSVSAGGPPVIARAGREQVRILTAPRKARGTSDTAHEAALATFESAKATLVAKLLETPLYAERIQARIDALASAKGGAAGATVTVADADLI